MRGQAQGSGVSQALPRPQEGPHNTAVSAPAQQLRVGRLVPSAKCWAEGLFAAPLASFLLPLASKPKSFPFGSFSGLCSK